MMLSISVLSGVACRLWKTWGSLIYCVSIESFYYSDSLQSIVESCTVWCWRGIGRQTMETQPSQMNASYFLWSKLNKKALQMRWGLVEVLREQDFSTAQLKFLSTWPRKWENFQVCLFDMFACRCLPDILTDIQTQNQNSKMIAKCEGDGLHPRIPSCGSDIRHTFRFYYFNSKLHNYHMVFQTVIWCCERGVKTSNSRVKGTVMIYGINTLCEGNRLITHNTFHSKGVATRLTKNLNITYSSKYRQRNKWVSKCGSQYELNNSSHAQSLGIQTCLNEGKKGWSGT